MRLGPWAHGEARYGGFPDWLVERNLATRTNDPAYLELVHAFYAQTVAQLRGLTHADGGPVVGAQVDNELYDQPQHLARLRELAEELGLRVPIWTATGWGGAQVPDTLLPVYSAYSDGFWDDEQTEWPEFSAFHFRYSPVRDDLSVGADLREALDGITLDPRRRAAQGRRRRALRDVRAGRRDARRVPPQADRRARRRRRARARQGRQRLDLAGLLHVRRRDAAHRRARLGAGVPRDRLPQRRATGDLRLRRPDRRARSDPPPPPLPAGPAPVAPARTGTASPRWPRRSAAAAPTRRSCGGRCGPTATAATCSPRRTSPRRRPLPEQRDVQLTVTLDDGDVTVPTQPVTIPAGVSLVWPLRYPLAPGRRPPQCDRTGAHSRHRRRPRGRRAGRLRRHPRRARARRGPRGRRGGCRRPPRRRDDRLARRTGRPDVRRRAAGARGSSSWTRRASTGSTCSRWTAGSGWCCPPRPLYALDGELVVQTESPDVTVSLLPAPARPPGRGRRPERAVRRRPLADVAGERAARRAAARSSPGSAPRRPRPRPERGGPLNRLSAPTDFSGAAVVQVDVPPDLFDGADRTLLRVRWTGDVGRAYVGDELISDHFWHGRDWDVDLTPWASAIARHGVRFELLPWQRSTGCLGRPDRAGDPRRGARRSSGCRPRRQGPSGRSGEIVTRRAEHDGDPSRLTGAASRASLQARVAPDERGTS